MSAECAAGPISSDSLCLLGRDTGLRRSPLCYNLLFLVPDSIRMSRQRLIHTQKQKHMKLPKLIRLEKIGNARIAHELSKHKLFEHPQRSGTSRQNSWDIPDSSLRNPRKTNFRGRARSFWATTPSRGRPPPLQTVSGPKKLIFVLFFLA